MVRLSALYLNNAQTAVLHRQAISARNGAALHIESNEVCPFGKNVKMIRNLTQRPVYLTANEKDEIAIKYENGLTMSDLAREYGCHYTTVGRLLRKKEVNIRDQYCTI